MKERYSIEKFYIEDPSVLIDNDTHQVILTLRDYCYDEINFLENLLNEQDEKIKSQEKIIANDNQRLIDKYFDELYKLDKEYNKDLNERLKELEKLKQENQQLKQQLDARIENLASKLRVSNSQLSSFELEYNKLKLAFNQQEKLLSEKIACNSRLQLENQQIAELKKALELACEHMTKFVIPCPNKKCGIECYQDKKECYANYFINQAKEGI